jgi:TonB-dependent receptor
MLSGKKLLFALIALVALALPARAQSGKGVITGTVKDSGNSALQGALVEVLPLGRKVVTDDHGQFRITDVPAGEYTLSVSYVGLAVSNAPMVVEAGKEINANAVLQVASQVDQVVVSAERLQGEAEAINIERTADNIVQVLPARVITSLPNTNIADAVGRLPSVTLERDEGEGKYVQIRGTEPRLSNVTIDGVNVPSPEATVRNIKLDVVPSSLVDRIEVNKTLAPNQDADAIGGSVNLVTRTPGERPTYNFSGQGGYTPIQGGRSLGGFDGNIGQRFGEGKKFGVIFGGTFDRNNRGIDDLEPAQTTGTFNGNNLAIINSQDLRSYSYYRTRYGFTAGLDYNLARGSSIYLKGFYSDFHDFGETWVYTPNSGNTIKSVNGSQITFDNATDCQAINRAADTGPNGVPGSNPCKPGNAQYRHYIRRPDQQIFSFLTGARHDLASTLITYEFSVSRAHNIGGQDFATTFFQGPAPSFDNAGNIQSPGVDYGLSLANTARPKLSPIDGTNVIDPSIYSITSSTVPFYHSTQLNFQGAALLARRYSVHSHFGTFELGLKIRDAHKTQNQNDQFLFPNANFTLSSVLGTYTNPNYYDHSFTFGPTSDYNKIRQLIANNLQNGGFARDLVNQPDTIVSDGATWDTRERVYAGYLMNAISFGKFRLLGGVRFEATDTSFLANVVNLSNGAFASVSPTVGSSGYINPLPSVQLQYQIEKNTNIRVAYGRGISRPNFSDLVPSKQIDPNTSPKSLQLGNPALKPTKANNYDVLVEHFFQPLGIIQAGFFYKQLSDPIYPTVVLLQAPDPNAGFLQQQSINGPSAHITGFEAAWEQRLSRLPGLLSGFGVSANYSYTSSRVTFPDHFSAANKGGEGRIDHPSLQRQAPNTWNLGFTYDKSRFSTRFGVSHNDTNIFAYGYQHTDAATDKDPIMGLKGPLGDQYLYAHTQFDLQGSCRLYKGLSFVASGLNLSNEVFGFYTGSPIYPNQREYYKPSVILGMRWTSSSE